MTRVAFGVAVAAVALSGGVATAQPPVWVGGPPPIGHVFGYSPLVPSVDPFPSRTSGYAPSIFGRNGGKRIYPSQYAHPVLYPPYASPRPATVVVVQEAPPVAEPGVSVGPVVRPLPARGWQRFGH